MLAGGEVRGFGGLVGVLLTLAVVGGPLGFGPLARPVAADQLTDPREMVARSLQAVLDASSLQVDVKLDGVLGEGILGPGAPRVRLDGASALAQARPPDALTRAWVSIPALDVRLESTTSWGDLWTRAGPGDAWTRASVGGVASEAGVDANPLTLVDRLRGYLARPDLELALDQAACPGIPASCRRITLDPGEDAVALLAAFLPEATIDRLPAVSTRVVLTAERTTLRPLRVTVTVRSEDGSIDLVLTLRTSRWDDPTIAIEVPRAGS